MRVESLIMLTISRAFRGSRPDQRALTCASMSRAAAVITFEIAGQQQTNRSSPLPYQGPTRSAEPSGAWALHLLLVPALPFVPAVFLRGDCGKSVQDFVRLRARRVRGCSILIWVLRSMEVSDVASAECGERAELERRREALLLELRFVAAELRADEALRVQEGERERTPERPRLDGR